jgi:hypothetical protein
MKTPMQEMFDQLKASKKDEYGLAFSIDMLLENEQAMLKKEKEVIVNAVKQGWDYNEEGLVQWMGETYYNETFNTNQENLQDSTNGYTYYPQENKTVFNTKEK